MNQLLIGLAVAALHQTPTRLETANYLVQVSALCQPTPTGLTHRYRAHYKHSSGSLLLHGRRWPLGCNQATCQGLVFYQRSVQYRLLYSGVLEVEQRGHLLVQEQGQWQTHSQQFEEPACE